jgi:hypothetical membrane protein
MELSEKKAVQFTAIAVIVVFVLSFLMRILSRESYSPFTNHISDLGIGAGAGWFNGGIIVTAILLFSFFVLLSKQLKKNTVSTLGIGMGAITSIGLVFVGIFPENIEFYHYAASMTFFLVSAGAAVLLSFVQQEKNKLAHIPAALFLISIFIGTLVISGILVQVGSEIVEHVTVLAFGLWILTTAFSQ